MLVSFVLKCIRKHFNLNKFISLKKINRDQIVIDDWSILYNSHVNAFMEVIPIYLGLQNCLHV
jgi:hypothetical protein